MRKSIGSFIGGVFAFAAVTSPALALDYPTKPVTVVVSFSPGGPVDALMRAVSQRLSKEWKQPVIIENKPGANEAIAAQYVAKATADGYTLLASTEGPLTQNQFLFKKLAYQPEKDLQPVTQLVQVPMALVVPAGFPANTLDEFLALTHKRANNPISYGSTGTGGVTHLPMAMLAKSSGISFVHVPYKGAAPLIPDLLSARVDAAFLAVSAIAPYVKDNKVKALVVSAPTRIKTLPQVPTFKELGVTDVQANFIMALTTPTGTPSAVVEKIAGSVQRIIADPQFRETYLEPFAYLPVGSSAKDFAAFLSKDRAYQAERVKVSGAVLD